MQLLLLSIVKPLKYVSMKRYSILFTVVVIVMLFGSCDEKTIERSSDNQVETLDSNKANILNVSGKLFSIPSPIQTALLIKNSDDTYRQEELADPSNYGNLSTGSYQAMNLGVYGTDMAYSSLYEDGQAALRYFKAIENLANALDVTAAIDAKLLRRLGNNVGNPDSLLFLTGRFYESADAYLKENERYDVASMVLLGGWIESSYLTAGAAISGNEAAKIRLAEQKGSITTLKEVIESTVQKNFKETEIYGIIDSIGTVYEGIDYSYQYIEPTTLSEEKRTVIKSRSEYALDESELNELYRLLTSARMQITAP